MRESRKFQAGKHEVEIKTYLTERENRELIKLLSGSFKVQDGEIKTDISDTETMLKYQDKMVESWIAGVDGSNENILEIMLDWDKEDYKLVVDEINKIGKDEEKKTK